MAEPMMHLGPEASEDIEETECAGQGFEHLAFPRSKSIQNRRTTVVEAVMGRKRSVQPMVHLTEEVTPSRARIINFVENDIFRTVMALIIILNFCFICLEADFRAAGELLPVWMEVGGYTFTTIYVIELVLKVYGFRKKFYSSFLNVSDFMIVVVDIGVLAFSGVSQEGLPSVAVLRTCRVLRIVRVLNSILVFRELYLMMQGLLSAIRAIAFGTSLLFVVLTTWSILAVEFLHPRVLELDDLGAFGDCPEAICRLAFRSVIVSDLTFVKTVVAGDSWGQLALPLMEFFPATGLILILTFISVQLGLVNVIAAVIVDRQTQSRVDDESLTHAVHQEELVRSYQKLQSLFTKLDRDRGGSLSLQEILVSYDTVEEFRHMLELLDIQKQDLPLVFEIMDADQSCDVTFTEFVEKLHYIRFLNDHTLLVFIKQLCENQVSGSVKFQEQLKSLTDATLKQNLMVTGTMETARNLLARTQEFEDRLTHVFLGDWLSTNRSNRGDLGGLENSTHPFNMNGISTAASEDTALNSSHRYRVSADDRKAVRGVAVDNHWQQAKASDSKDPPDPTDGIANREGAGLCDKLKVYQDQGSGVNSAEPHCRMQGPASARMASPRNHSPGVSGPPTYHTGARTASSRDHFPGVSGPPTCHTGGVASPRDHSPSVSGPGAYHRRDGKHLPLCASLCSAFVASRI
eukprot:TRINITY_DN12706_c0_g1_i3.p1 TRINITY_DN12706_c0_g1~~TRINITY_DN12706_c0_g1_i3.p1  ORF type:complete len:701 (-),score=93.68 TRINITY_DN12706_c0_g1_i3:155-2221(-)